MTPAVTADLTTLLTACRAATCTFLTGEAVWERLMDGPMKPVHVDWSPRRPDDLKCWLKFTCCSLFLWLTFIKPIIPLPFKISITRLGFLFLAPHFITEIYRWACLGRSAVFKEINPIHDHGISHGFTADILPLIKISFSYNIFLRNHQDLIFEPGTESGTSLISPLPPYFFILVIISKELWQTVNSINMTGCLIPHWTLITCLLYCL